MILPLSAAIGALGALLLVLGVRGKRIDEHPWCRRCRYDLSGLDAPSTCAECGADLTKRRAVRIGQRRKRPVVLSLGALMLAAALTGGGFVGYQTDWTRAKPLWLLKHESVHRDAAKRRAAIREMIRRLGRSEVSASQRRSVVELALAQQRDVNIPWNYLWGELMREEWAAGRLSDEQKDAFLRGAFTEGVTLQVKAVVRSGGTLPIRIIAPPFRVSSTGAPGPVFTAMISIESVAIGEWEDTRLWFPGTFEMFPRVVPFASGSHASARVDAPPGEHDVSVRCRIGVLQGQADPWAASWDEAIATWHETHRLRVRVAGTDEPIIELVDDEPLAEEIRSSMRIGGLRMRTSPNGHVVSASILGVNAPPIGLGFTIHVRPRDGAMQGLEFEAGEGAAAAGQSRSVVVGRGAVHWPRDCTAVDIILRPSAAVAERDLDVAGPIWDGDVVIEDVPVLWED